MIYFKQYKTDILLYIFNVTTFSNNYSKNNHSKNNNYEVSSTDFSSRHDGCDTLVTIRNAHVLNVSFPSKVSALKRYFNVVNP